MGAIAAGCLIVLRSEPEKDMQKHFRIPEKAQVRNVCLIALAVFVILLLGIFWFDRTSLFIFPRTKPGVWGLVMLLYPLFSALPQELVYRTFLFQRYKNVLPQPILLLLSTLAFALLHIFFNNALALGGSALAGGLFTYRYFKHESLWLVTLEHALYGCIVFTVGLGQYFYLGATRLQ